MDTSQRAKGPNGLCKFLQSVDAFTCGPSGCSSKCCERRESDAAQAKSMRFQHAYVRVQAMSRQLNEHSFSHTIAIEFYELNSCYTIVKSHCLIGSRNERVVDCTFTKTCCKALPKSYRFFPSTSSSQELANKAHSNS